MSDRRCPKCGGLNNLIDLTAASDSLCQCGGGWKIPDYEPDGSANPKGDAAYWRERAEDAEARATAAEAEAGRLRAVVDAIQWESGIHGGVCPLCGGNEAFGGHRKDCQLAAALTPPAPGTDTKGE